MRAPRPHVGMAFLFGLLLDPVRKWESRLQATLRNNESHLFSKLLWRIMNSRRCVASLFTVQISYSQMKFGLGRLWSMFNLMEYDWCLAAYQLGICLSGKCSNICIRSQSPPCNRTQVNRPTTRRPQQLARTHQHGLQVCYDLHRCSSQLSGRFCRPSASPMGPTRPRRQGAVLLYVETNLLLHDILLTEGPGTSEVPGGAIAIGCSRYSPQAGWYVPSPLGVYGADFMLQYWNH
jgi:hypothetical protein